jgi:Flp pilus assembly protein TadG
MASLTTSGQGVLRAFNRFRKDARGVAAIEFALIAPIMIGLYIMLNETSSALRAARKVTMASRIASDLTTQLTNVADSDRDDVFASVTPIMSPYPGTKASIRITSIRFDAAGKGYVDWSEAQNATPGPALPAHVRCKPTEVQSPPSGLGQIVVPAGLKVANTSIVLAEVVYAYTPSLGYNITGTINLTDQLYTRPRAGTHVTRTGSPATPCTV